MNREELVQRMGAATLGVFDIASTYLGVKLGLYRSLAEDGPATAAELAARTGTNERLVREWLEQQGATELLDATNDGGEWRFALPPGHAAVLLDPDALDGVAGTVHSLIADLAQVPRLVESFRTGDRDPVRRLRSGRGRGPGARHPAGLPGRDRELAGRRTRPGGAARQSGARGCWTSAAASAGRASAWRRPIPGVAGGRRRPRPRLDRGGQTGRRVRGRGGPGAVRAPRRRHPGRSRATTSRTMFEMLHDLARPVEALRAAREALNPDGVVLVADEPCGDAFAGPGRRAGTAPLRLQRAALPPREHDRTGLRRDRHRDPPRHVRRYARDAGFSSVEVLPVESVAFRLYLLRP